MIDKKTKTRALENIKEKDEKILVSNILDKAERFEKNNVMAFSNFLNLSELNIVKKVLDYLKIEYNIFSVNCDVEKKVIFFLPDYLKGNENKIFSEHIKVLKIIPNKNANLLHKDYMGAIYSLGIKREFIGDIIVKKYVAYFFCMNSVVDYVILNLNSVGKQNISIELVDLFSDEVKLLSLNFTKKDYIVPSFRVDAILSEVYKLSRSETKDKIIKGDLYINDKNIFYPSTILKNSDIVSFRKCGKLKIGDTLRCTKSGNFVIEVFKYS